MRNKLNKLFKSLLLTSILLAPNFASALNNIDPLYYLKLNIGANKLYKTVKGAKYNQDSTTSPMIGVGAGYCLDDKTRVDLTFDYSVHGFKAVGEGFKDHQIKAFISKVHIHSIMANLYTDIYNDEKFNIFVGGGVGVSYIHEKAGWVVFLPNGEQMTGVMARKLKNNFTYAFMIGGGFNLTSNTTLELAYNWKDLGSSKPKQINELAAMPAKHYRGHIGTFGVRYNI